MIQPMAGGGEQGNAHGTLACPCGEEHPVDPRLAELVVELGETIPFSTPEGRWHVPRVFIAAHGLKAPDLARLAAEYGFRRA